MHLIFLVILRIVIADTIYVYENTYFYIAYNNDILLYFSIYAGKVLEHMFLNSVREKSSAGFTIDIRGHYPKPIDREVKKGNSGWKTQIKHR